jgi:hypothetical protein
LYRTSRLGATGTSARPPLLDMTVRACGAARSWLSLDARNVAVFYASGEESAALVTVSCFLTFDAWGEADAFE